MSYSNRTPRLFILALFSLLSTVVHALDSDGDGMPDDWETAYGFNPNNASTALEIADADSDGYCNLLEYMAGSDPTLASSKPAVLTISTTDDTITAQDNALSLREAVQKFGGETDGIARTIHVPAGTYLLTHPTFDDLDLIVPNLSIVGAGKALTIIDGNGTDRVFDINNASNVTIDNLTIQNGFVDTEIGGGIRAINSPNLTLSNLIIKDNVFDNDNHNNRDGGAGLASYQGCVTISNSSIINNTTTSAQTRELAGSGVWLKSETCNSLIEYTEISNNTVTSAGRALGAAIAIEGGSSSETLTIQASLIANNTSTSIDDHVYGAAISHRNSTQLVINNSTISSNTGITQNSNRSADGGGLFIDVAALIQLESNTFYANTISVNGANGRGGNLYVKNSNSLMTLQNNIFAGEAAGQESQFQGVTNNGYNLFQSSSVSNVTFVATDKLDMDPLLGPLQDNGGETFTHALLTGSPAIDAGSTALASDQRGIERPQNGTDDIGAFEVAGSLIPDAVLNQMVHTVLGIDESIRLTVTDLATLIQLDISSSAVASLEGLNYAVNLSSLNLSNTTLDGLDALLGITNLSVIYAGTILPAGYDSDGDSFDDNWEIANAFSPIDASDPDLSIDTDGDRVPDVTELLNGLDPNNSADTIVDGDGDGYTLGQELVAGSLDSDSSSLPQVLGVEHIVPIANGLDDVESESGTFRPNNSILYFWYDSNWLEIIGMRFALPLAQGEAIASARIEFTASNDAWGNYAGDDTINIHLEESLNASQPDSQFVSRTYFSDTVSWQLEPEAWIEGQSYQTADLTILVNDVLAQPGWVSGSYVFFKFDYNASDYVQRQIYAYEQDASLAPRLIINTESMNGQPWDSDNDGIIDASDNCPLSSNADQADTDGDGEGDVCDDDDDNDGVLDSVDSCPLQGFTRDINPVDGCEDPDSDADGLYDDVDNCPAIANADQTDTDADGEGDVCDLDDDNDGVADVSDAFPLDASETIDTDGDGIGNNADSDDDNDTVEDLVDNCSLLSNVDQTNTDGDNEGDACDSDDDNDTVADSHDNCPLVINSFQRNNDNDTEGDACDLDDDNDTVEDISDNCPFTANSNQVDTDGDSEGDACDLDDDNDTFDDASDNCSLVANLDQADIEGDGIGDACDTDNDNDTIENSVDNCPLIPNTDQVNTDAETESLWVPIAGQVTFFVFIPPTGDACDEDDDADGIVDIVDNCPLAANPLQEDLDGDAAGDACDTDDDNDGVADASDSCPLGNLGTGLTPIYPDTDGDGCDDIEDQDDDNDNVADTVDSCPLGNILVSDYDGDGCNDLDEDADDDNDGVADADDSCPIGNALTSDYDGDGCNDADEDQDDDNDSIADTIDACPLGEIGTGSGSGSSDADGDGCSDFEDNDADNDGIANGSDNCPVNNNPSQDNFDGDALGDVCDTDDDNDGIADASDDCAFGALGTGNNPQSADTDGDGCIDNGEDDDDDADGLVDGSDACPLGELGNGTMPGSVDTDGDGCTNNEDDDSDNDGLPDDWENSYGFDPLVAGEQLESADQDGDGYSNLLEYLAGSDPTLATSVPTILTVSTINDAIDITDNALSLREAVILFNGEADGAARSIHIPAGTYTLTLTGANEDLAATGDLDIIVSNLSIIGENKESTILDGNASDRIFDFISGLNLSNNAITNLTVQNGLIDGGNGAGINSEGVTNLTVSNLIIQNNHRIGNSGHRDGGGGISFRNGCFTLSNSEVRNNTLDQTDNEMSGGGVRIKTPQCDSIIEYSEITDNSISTDKTIRGAGISVDGGSSAVTITINASLIANNTGSSAGGHLRGGGIGHKNGTSLMITNSTITNNNVTTEVQGNDTLGGALYVHDTINIELTSNTFAYNTVTPYGSTLPEDQNIYIRQDTSATVIQNNIFALEGTVDLSLFNMGVTNLGYNLFEAQMIDDPNLIVQTTDMEDVEANLGALQDNGGPTRTMAPQLASPAIDAGNSTLTSDQRGMARPADGNGDAIVTTDIGAFEVHDTDGDGIPNYLDTDDDGDGVDDAVDQMPLDGSESVDTDGDGIGDNADTDDDNDGVIDTLDDLPLNPNETVDSDGDGIGDNADLDDDGDTVYDWLDNCPATDVNDTDHDRDGCGDDTQDNDDDNDGIDDSLDDCPRGDVVVSDNDLDGCNDDTEDEDDDNDTIIDDSDNCQYLANVDQLDFDGDRDGDACDVDVDGDGVFDTNDNCLFYNDPDQTDTDFDGAGNVCDNDDDNDGVPDVDDVYDLISIVGYPDNDHDGAPDVCDPACVSATGMSEDLDDDNDGILDDVDLYPNISLGGLADNDNDGAPDVCIDDCLATGMTEDLDDDNDGVPDDVDLYPVISLGSLSDNDHDGAPDVCVDDCLATGMTEDLDDDNDGVLDVDDLYPFVDIGGLLDTDSDGAPDDCDEACILLGMAVDPDDDNDGVLDENDEYPTISLDGRADNDGDGIPDVCDATCVATTGMAEDLDDDNDQIPDDIEITWGLDPFDSVDAGQDKDHDGYTNLQEYLAGSDPADTDSTPGSVIEKFTVSTKEIKAIGESVTLSWKVNNATLVTLIGTDGLTQELASVSVPNWSGEVDVTPAGDPATYYTLQVSSGGEIFESKLKVVLNVVQVPDTWAAAIAAIDDFFNSASLTVTEDLTRYIGSKDGNYYAYGADGNKLAGWPLQDIGEVSNKALLLDNALIIGTKAVSEAKGQVVSLQPDKTVNWMFVSDGAVIASPVANNSQTTIYAVSFNGVVYAIDKVTGTERWRYKLPDDKAFVVSEPVLPKVESGDQTKMVVRTTNNAVYVIDLTNPDERLIWSKELK